MADDEIVKMGLGDGQDQMQMMEMIERGDPLDYEDEKEMVMVLQDGNFEMQHQSCVEIQEPLQSVTEVLREAENIIMEGTAVRQPLQANAEVLLDEVDVAYSPRHHSHLPIEIVVRHNTVVTSSNYDSDDSDDEMQGLNANRDRKMNFPSIKEDVEYHMTPCSSNSASSSKQPQKSDFKKGHRRAWSMPNSNGQKMMLAVIDDNVMMDDGMHRRHIVRYRLHPHRKRDSSIMREMANGDLSVPKFEEDVLLAAAEDDNELEIEINEEEITCVPESDRGTRTIVKRFWEARWKAQNFELLPEWLQDNEYLKTGHRPPLPSFGSCFKSIFALHTETGNIWTHMYGCVAFVGLALYFLTRPHELIQWPEKLVFTFFFLGAVACLGMSFTFHTVQCHSVGVGKLFSKLDYTGITLLIVGSFIPWIYYGFYCRPQPMIIYIGMISVLGVMAMIVSLWDKFAQPKFRPVRALVFVAMGLSSIVPAIHFLVTDGLKILFEQASLHWLLLMGFMYLLGAGLYASRTPERCFPGKCDLWFQSHQLFHTFVVAAAFVHFHGICEVARNRMEQGSCAEQLLERYGAETNPSYLGGWLGLDH